MKYTLLDIVQTTLASMDGDEVNSITDTVEALQIAYIARRVYYRICASGDLPKYMSTFNLTASNVSSPTLMYKPDTVLDIQWLKYNNATLTATFPQLIDVYPLQLDEFLNRMYLLNTTQTNVVSFNITVNSGDAFKIISLNNKAPQFYTSFDDRTIVFDSYDSSVDTNLQSSKVLGYGELSQTFLLTDSFIPGLTDNQFDLLLNETIATAHAEVRQAANIKAENAARRGWINLQRTKRAVPLDVALGYLPNYGRRVDKSGYSHSKTW